MDIHIVGNVYLDNLEFDDCKVPNYPYNLVLYNPPTRHGVEEVEKELKQVKEIVTKFKIDYLWIEPNGDLYSDSVTPYVTHFNFPRPQFLSLMKHCEHFITNSSCQYFEAKQLLKPEQIISIGRRNIDRESRYTDMTIPNASDNIIKILEKLK
jgi:UDP-N-acetylglucosamine 2-epimerase